MGCETDDAGQMVALYVRWWLRAENWYRWDNDGLAGSLLGRTADSVVVVLTSRDCGCVSGCDAMTVFVWYCRFIIVSAVVIDLVDCVTSFMDGNGWESRRFDDND